MNGDFCSGARANTHHAADHAKDASLARLVQLSTLTIPTDSSHVLNHSMRNLLPMNSGTMCRLSTK
jgi:hypothetical protein